MAWSQPARSHRAPAPQHSTIPVGGGSARTGELDTDRGCSVTCALRDPAAGTAASLSVCSSSTTLTQLAVPALEARAAVAVVGLALAHTGASVLAGVCRAVLPSACNTSAAISPALMPVGPDSSWLDSPWPCPPQTHSCSVPRAAAAPDCPGQAPRCSPALWEPLALGNERVNVTSSQGQTPRQPLCSSRQRGPSLAAGGWPGLQQFSPSLVAPWAQPTLHPASPPTANSPALGSPTRCGPPLSLGRGDVSPGRGNGVLPSPLAPSAPQQPAPLLPCPGGVGEAQEIALGDRRRPKRQQGTYVSSR